LPCTTLSARLPSRAAGRPLAVSPSQEPSICIHASDLARQGGALLDGQRPSLELHASKALVAIGEVTKQIFKEDPDFFPIKPMDYGRFLVIRHRLS
ncbi:unnamed protein product, partial [Urochloa humidicola]